MPFFFDFSLLPFFSSSLASFFTSTFAFGSVLAFLAAGPVKAAAVSAVPVSVEGAAGGRVCCPCGPAGSGPGDVFHGAFRIADDAAAEDDAGSCCPGGGVVVCGAVCCDDDAAAEHDEAAGVAGSQ